MIAEVNKESPSYSESNLQVFIDCLQMKLTQRPSEW
jgi:hypothetical protein